MYVFLIANVNTRSLLGNPPVVMPLLALALSVPSYAPLWMLHGEGVEQREGEEGQPVAVCRSHAGTASGAGSASRHHPIHLKVRGRA